VGGAVGFFVSGSKATAELYYPALVPERSLAKEDRFFENA
jgi:hypothetical protein